MSEEEQNKTEEKPSEVEVIPEESKQFLKDYVKELETR